MEYGFAVDVEKTRIVQKTTVLDVRSAQARALWDHGWGRGRFSKFEAYLSTIPVLTRGPRDRRFSTPVLVDTSMKLTDACRLVGISFGGDESIFTIPPSRTPDAEVYWVWVCSRPTNAGMAPFHAVQLHNTFERTLIAYEGVAYLIQYPDALVGGVKLCLAGSRLCSFPAYCACLLEAEGQPTLGVTEYCRADPEQETLLRWW